MLRRSGPSPKLSLLDGMLLCFSTWQESFDVEGKGLLSSAHARRSPDLSDKRFSQLLEPRIKRKPWRKQQMLVT